MKADDLVALAAAHGVDLLQAAKTASTERNRSQTQRQRFANGRRATVLIEPPVMRARGSATRTTDRPEWTLEELGQASAGVPQVAFWAACFAFAGDRSEYWRLWDRLHYHALQLRWKQGWPAQLPGEQGRPVHYLAQIAQLVLDEDAHPHLFLAAPVLYSAYVGVSEDVWRSRAFERFDSVKLIYLGWIDEARRIIQPRLRENEEEVE